MNVSYHPGRDPLVEKDGKLTSKRWPEWFYNLVTRLNRTVDRRQIVALTGQTASIVATDVPLPTLTAGLYRVTYYARVTRAATTSSELTVSLRWTDGGVTITRAGTLLNGNTTGTYETGSALVRIDNATTLRYLTTYASVGATAMAYALYLVVEEVPLTEAV
jgi:hypothetical protein